MAWGLLGTQEISFNFPDTPETTKQTSITLLPPPGTQTVAAYMSGFDAAYSDNNQYGFGEFGVSVQCMSNTQATCKMSLRDNNVNKRAWGGVVYAIVMYFG